MFISTIGQGVKRIVLVREVFAMAEDILFSGDCESFCIHENYRKMGDRDTEAV